MTWKILHRAALRAIACSIGLYAFAIAHIHYMKDDLENSLIVVGLYLAGVFLILSGLTSDENK